MLSKQIEHTLFLDFKTKKYLRGVLKPSKKKLFEENEQTISTTINYICKNIVCKYGMYIDFLSILVISCILYTYIEEILGKETIFLDGCLIFLLL